MILPFVGFINLTLPIGTPTGEGLCNRAFGLVTYIFSLFFHWKKSVTFGGFITFLQNQKNALWNS